MTLKELGDEFPTHRIKGFADVKLEEKRWDFALVEPSCKIVHIHKIIVNVFLIYESTLSLGDKIVHERHGAER
jgi:hypothetical protein